MDLSDRYRGSLLGMATGDALGTTCEFAKPGTFVPISDMLGGGPFKLKAGEWTDDTSLALPGGKLDRVGKVRPCRSIAALCEMVSYCSFEQ